MKNTKALGNALLLAVAFVWGICFIFKAMGASAVGAFTFNATRMFLAAAAMAAVICITQGPKSLLKYDRPTVMGGLISGFLLTFSNVIQQHGLMYTTSGKCAFISTLNVIIIPIASLILFKRRQGGKVWLGVVIGVCGLYLMCINGETGINIGDVLCLLSALFFTAHLLSSGKYTREGDSLKICLIEFLVICAICTVMALIFEDTTMADIKAGAIAILYTGLISGGLGYGLQMVAQKYADPVTASLIMSTQTIFAALAGWIVLHEIMSGRELIGCAVLLLGILIVEMPVPERFRKEIMH